MATQKLITIQFYMPQTVYQLSKIIIPLDVDYLWNGFGYCLFLNLDFINRFSKSDIKIV